MPIPTQCLTFTSIISTLFYTIQNKKYSISTMLLILPQVYTFIIPVFSHVLCRYALLCKSIVIHNYLALISIMHPTPQSVSWSFHQAMLAYFSYISFCKQIIKINSKSYVLQGQDQNLHYNLSKRNWHRRQGCRMFYVKKKKGGNYWHFFGK